MKNEMIQSVIDVINASDKVEVKENRSGVTATLTALSNRGKKEHTMKLVIEDSNPFRSRLYNTKPSLTQVRLELTTEEPYDIVLSGRIDIETHEGVRKIVELLDDLKGGAKSQAGRDTLVAFGYMKNK